MKKDKAAKKAEKAAKKQAKKEAKAAKKLAKQKAKEAKKNKTNPTEEVKTTTTSKTTKAPTNIYYVSARYDGKSKEGWEIKRGNAARVTAVCKTKEEAKEKVKMLAKSSEATVIIYKMDGKIDETYKISNKK